LELKIFLIIFFATGIITNLFVASLLTTAKVSGIISCVSGALGSFVSYLFLNWKSI
jgi:hypothetical protein